MQYVFTEFYFENMFILKANLAQYLRRFVFAWKLLLSVLLNFNIFIVNRKNLIAQIIIVGPESLGIIIITASFIGIVFTLQVIKEFLYLDASSFIGAILSIAFIRELSPVFTAVIIAGRIGSFFASELATMKVTEQIDALYLLNTNPIIYLVLPRLLSCILVLPFLNLFFFFSSLFISMFICSIFYHIHPLLFFNSMSAGFFFEDILKSTFKVLVFGFILSIVSCSWGLTTIGGSKSVGQATTSSVVTSLLMIFVVDFVLTYLLFSQNSSIIESL